MIDIKDIVPEEPEEQLYCTTCEQFVILSKKHYMRSCKCERVVKSGVSMKSNWVLFDDMEVKFKKFVHKRVETDNFITESLLVCDTCSAAVKRDETYCYACKKPVLKNTHWVTIARVNVK